VRRRVFFVSVAFTEEIKIAGENARFKGPKIDAGGTVAERKQHPHQPKIHHQSPINQSIEVALVAELLQG